MEIFLIVLGGVLVVVISAIIIGVGRWVFLDKLGWFAPKKSKASAGDRAVAPGGDLKGATVTGDKSAAASHGGVAISGEAGDVTVNIHGEDPEARAEIREVKNQLDQLKAEVAQTQQGVADIGTDELAKAAGPETPGLLEEALQLQAENKEREAIERLLTAYNMGLPLEAKGQLHLLAGNSFLKLSELEEAEGHYRQALDASRQAGHRKGEAAALGNLGIVYTNQGGLDRAEEHHKQALGIHGEIGNKPGEAIQLNNLGIVYNNRGDLDRAVEYHNRSLEIVREIGDSLGEASSLGNLGLVYHNKGDLDRAEEYHKQALEIDREIGVRGGEADDLCALGLVYARQGELVRAEEHYTMALEIHRDIGYRLGEARDLGNLGNLAAKRNESEEACQFLKEALAIFEEIGARSDVEKAHAALEELGCG